jgi:hypothetical protein
VNGAIAINRTELAECGKYVLISTHFPLQSHITWRIVSALNVGHHQAVIHKLENAYRNSVQYNVASNTTNTLKICIKCIGMSNYKRPKDIYQRVEMF